MRDRFRSALETAGHKAIAVKSARRAAGAGARRSRARSISSSSICGCRRRPASIWSGRFASSTTGRLPILIFSGTIASADEVRELAALGVAGYVNEYSAVQHILPSLAPHLFPDNFNRRSSPRVVLGIPIQYRFGNTIAAALTLNLSHGGIAIRTTSPLESGSKIKVRFRMPGSKTRHRRRGPRRLERPPRRHGHPVREGRSGQPDHHRQLRRRAFLLEPESVNRHATHQRCVSMRRSESALWSVRVDYITQYDET